MGCRNAQPSRGAAPVRPKCSPAPLGRMRQGGTRNFLPVMRNTCSGISLGSQDCRWPLPAVKGPAAPAAPPAPRPPRRPRAGTRRAAPPAANRSSLPLRSRSHLLPVCTALQVTEDPAHPELAALPRGAAAGAASLARKAHPLAPRRLPASYSSVPGPGVISHQSAASRGQHGSLCAAGDRWGGRDQPDRQGPAAGGPRYGRHTHSLSGTMPALHTGQSRHQPGAHHCGSQAGRASL